MDNEYLDIIGLGIFKALNDKRYPILVNGKISESAIPTSITNSITSILSLIPDAASSENKLADKNFVNSSIATNTATFRGTFDDLATLQSTSADINDYAFYVHTDEIGNTAYDRYKHNGSTWVFEYTLNNSSFTAEQWNAINSGITTTKVGNYDAHLINYSNPHKVTKSQVGLGNVENVALSSWAGSNKITTLGTITTGVWNGTKITNTYLANSSITIGTTAISLGSTTKSLAGIEKLQLNDTNSNLVYDSTTGSWKLTGNLLVTGFISAGAKGNSSSGGGSTYTQKEWLQIKEMTESASGILASAYAVKEAYNELNTAIETLAGKATNVKFTQTLTSGKQIGSISIDGKSTSLFAPANYAWSEVTGKPSFATVATSGSYSDLTNKPTIASLMGSTAIGGTSSYLYWNGSAWATRALGTAAFASSSDFAAASHTHSNYVDLTSYQTITGNKKFSGAIQVGAIGINTDNVGLYGYGEDAVEIHAENILTLCGERNTYIGNADNSAMVDIQEDMTGYNAETGVETWYIYRDGEAYFKNIIGALAQSLAIKLNGGTTEGTNLFTYNNSAAKTIDITPSAIGAAASSHTHSVSINGVTKTIAATGGTAVDLGSYLPLAGGTMSNTNVVTNLNADLLDGFDITSVVSARYGGDTQDLNEISIPSIYRLRANNPNLPSGFYDSNILTVKIPNNDTAWQLLGVYSSDKLLYRRGTWFADGRGTLRTNAWKEIAFTDSNVASSSKWATPRTITLTGSVTGSVSIDGSQNVSLATTTNHTHNYAGSSSAGGSANSALTLLYNNKFDTTYGSYAIFQQSSNIRGFPHNGWFNSIKMLHNNSSGYFTEIAMSFTGEDGMWRRALQGGSPAGWYKILDSGNYNSYAPKLDGTGATGTWGINISGNAATATTLYTTKIESTQSNVTYYKISGILNTSITTTIFRITTRNSESYLLYVCNDGNGIVTPRITRERNMYSKIASFAWSGQDLYIKANYYSLGIYITQINGTAISYSVTTTDESTYNSATSITIDESAFLTSNVASASKWSTARTITLTGSVTGSVSIDGSADVSLVTTTNHTHSYLPLSGGMMSNTNVVTNLNADLLDGYHESDFSRHITGTTRTTGTKYFKLGNLPKSSDSTWDAFLIQGEIGGWASLQKTVLNVCVGRRNGVAFCGYTQGQWNRNLGIDIGVNDAGEIVLIVTGQYCAWTLDLHAIQGTISYTGTTFTPTDTNFVLLSSSNNISKSLADGTVEKATKLANSRTIWGQSFDGTGNVSGALTGVTDITASGNVTTTGSIYGQSGVLAINSSGAVLSLNGIPGTSYTYGFYNNSDCGAGIRIVSSRSGAAPIVFDSLGNVGIGTTSPAYKLDVNGETHTLGLRTNCIELSAETPFIDFHYNNSTADFTSRIIEGLSGQLTVTGKLRVGLNYTTSTDYKLHIVGVAYASEGLVSDGYISGAATSTSSDIRLKDDISEISSEMALKWLSMLKPKSWSWNSLAGVKGRSMGFVAQDVEGILPQMIRKRRDNDYLSLDYTQLHALEVAGLQDHEKRIEELERENKILKAEINRLKQYAN